MKHQGLSQATLDDLARSGLTADDATVLGITELGGWRPGYRIPYPGTEGYWRVRFHTPRPGRKPQRYDQPEGAPPHLYLAPLKVDWAAVKADSTVPLYVVEGEKKAAALCKAGLAAIGVGGVACWRSKEYSGALPQWDEFAWSGRRVTIAYDADIVEKPDVAREERLLGAELTRRGAEVLRVRLPLETKGADDFLVANGLPRAVQRARRAWRALPTEPVEPPTEEDKAEERTQLGLARRFVRRYQDDSLFVHDGAVGWLHYVPSEGRFRPDVDAEALRRMTAVVDSLLDEVKAERLPERRKAAFQFWNACSRADVMTSALRLAAADERMARTSAEFDTCPDTVNAANGVTIDLRTGDARGSTRQDLHTKALGAPYDERARADEWEELVAYLLSGDEEKVRFAQRMCGYLLTGRVNEQKFFVCDGTGKNGKSTMLGILQKVLGGYATSVGSDAVTKRGRERGGHYQLVETVGARMVVLYESAEGAAFDTELVKAMTGGDPLTVRPIYGKPFTFRPQFKPVLITNHLPSFDGGDAAMARRILRLRFEVVIPESKREDKDVLEARLLRNSAGILNWALEGARQWYESGLCPPKSVLVATKVYLNDQDLIGRWISECCDEGAAHESDFHELFASYCNWAERNNERRLSSNAFSRRLQERGHHKRATTRRNKQTGKNDNVTVFSGLRLRGKAAAGTPLVVIPGGRKY
jgi:P4 family phage/plasmid primase-like protien